MAELFRRIRYLLFRRRFDAELENDIAFHREMAARQGNNNFGNTTRIQEKAREAWGWTWLDRILQDLRFGARLLAKSPGFTLIAVLVLAIGIGVNVGAFSFFNMVALKLLPVRDPNTIVRLERRAPTAYSSEMAYPIFAFYRDHAKTLSAAIAVLGVPPMQMDDDAQPASVSFVTPNYCSELGTRAALGRLFDPARDNSAGDNAIAIISFELWQRRFGGDPSVIGRIVHLNGKPATIAGITPWDFASLGGQHPDLWLSMAQQPYFIQGSHLLTDFNDSGVRMWGRLAPGVTATMAEQDLRSLAAELRREHPQEIWDQEFVQISPGGHMLVMQPAMYQVAGMVGVLTLLILAVACANLGGLLLARAVTREHEIGIRIAIGANRARIFRQLCTESLLLATMGSLAGLALSWAVLRVVLMKAGAPGWLKATPDWRVILFTAGMTLAASLFFGLTPALHIARQRQRKTTARQILIGAQVAASCVLLIVAALLLRAAQHALYTDPGFGYQQLLTVDPQLGHHGYTPTDARAYLDQMQTRMRAVPGVRSVSLVLLPPLGHTVSREDRTFNGHRLPLYPNWIEPGFFQTMEIPILLGRTFYPGEKNAVIVSHSWARQQWPNQNPIGQRLSDGGREFVVGVAGDAHINALNDDDAVEQYWPAQQDNMPGMVLVARVAGDPAVATPAIKAISESLAPRIFPEIRRLNLLYHEQVLPVEQISAAVTLIGIVAGLLAAVGIIGLVVFSISQRTREIAIRIALGAEPARIIASVLRQFATPVAIGLLLGAGGAAAASRLLRVALFGVSNLDAASYVAAVGLLLAVILLSALIPARRTLRLDLSQILHHD
ncbi:MAG TPA: ABC transporter permease [Acidobacteriaceae bacterium]|jgi:predicted permease|nr:ABC transporter permease [Acidobacteriaceae bacterium]